MGRGLVGRLSGGGIIAEAEVGIPFCAGAGCMTSSSFEEVLDACPMDALGEDCGFPSATAGRSCWDGDFSMSCCCFD